MKNKEKYAECVLTFACDESGFGVYEKTGEMERCIARNACFTGRKKLATQADVNGLNPSALKSQ